MHLEHYFALLVGVIRYQVFLHGLLSKTRQSNILNCLFHGHVEKCHTPENYWVFWISINSWKFTYIIGWNSRNLFHCFRWKVLYFFRAKSFNICLDVLLIISFSSIITCIIEFSSATSQPGLKITGWEAWRVICFLGSKTRSLAPRLAACLR